MSHIILIADAGSTKVQWLAVDTRAGEWIDLGCGAGINALMSTADGLTASIGTQLAELLSPFTAADISKVVYYGAGCVDAEVCSTVAEALRRVLGESIETEVHSDLVCAARALLGRAPGIACIIGTGSNSCLWDGHSIRANISPLGYILGDEGSGAALGRRLLGDLYKGMLPAELLKDFEAETGITRSSAIRCVYRQPAPNTFLASLVPFIAGHISHPALRQMVIGCFEDFLRRNVERYPGYREQTLAFTGGVASVLEAELTEACVSRGLTISRIVKAPAEAIADYHLCNH